MEIYLIRHTTPEVVPGYIYGRTDVALSKTFLEEKEVICNKIPKDFDLVYSSPSTRCTLLAEALYRDFKIDERLYEFHFGNWEGKTWDTVDKDELKRWMEDYVNVCAPQGENMLKMQERVLSFWNDLLKEPSKKILIITHGGVIRLVLSHLNQSPLKKAFDYKITYGDTFLIRPHENNLSLISEKL